MPEYSGIALEHHRIRIFWNFFKLQGVGCGFYSKLHIFQHIVGSKDFFNPFSVFWNVHVGKRRSFAENIQHFQSSVPCHRKERRSILSCVQHTKQQIDFLALLVHLGKSICRNIQRITGKSADRKCFALIYDRILPKIQCHQFLIHTRPPVLFFHFFHYTMQI